MKTLIITGTHELITSGSFITFDELPVTLSIQGGEKENVPSLKIIFEFIEDGSQKDSKIEFSSDGTGMTIRMINFNNVFGQGLAAPAPFATDSNGKQYYICFVVKSFLNKSQKNIVYSIYRDI